VRRRDYVDRSSAGVCRRTLARRLVGLAGPTVHRPPLPWSLSTWLEPTEARRSLPNSLDCPLEETSDRAGRPGVSSSASQAARADRRSSTSRRRRRPAIRPTRSGGSAFGGLVRTAGRSRRADGPRRAVRATPARRCQADQPSAISRQPSVERVHATGRRPAVHATPARRCRVDQPSAISRQPAVERVHATGRRPAVRATPARRCQADQPSEISRQPSVKRVRSTGRPRNPVGRGRANCRSTTVVPTTVDSVRPSTRWRRRLDAADKRVNFAVGRSWLDLVRRDRPNCQSTNSAQLLVD